MREIKFRVWDKLNETYCVGAKVTLLPNRTLVPNHITLDSCDIYKIEQYTGLKDKNGVEIYEGDILKVPIWKNPLKNFPTSIEYFVRWDNSTTGFTLIDIEGDDEQFFNEAFEYEVIGNIHEGVIK